MEFNVSKSIYLSYLKILKTSYLTDIQIFNSMLFCCIKKLSVLNAIAELTAMVYSDS